MTDIHNSKYRGAISKGGSPSFSDHRKIYFDFFGYAHGDIVICEITGKPAHDIMHIDPRGMGGRDSVNKIENLMAGVRIAHNFFEGIFKEELTEQHLLFMEDRIPWVERDRFHPVLQKFLNEAYGIF